MDGRLNPGPGELFVMRWRVKVDEVTGYSDPGMQVFSDDAWGSEFVLNVDTIYTSDGKKASFAPGVFHEFGFRSGDMRTYDLSIDGVPRLSGVFFKAVSTSRVLWGDIVGGAAGLHRWDYLRFGVVPEPTVGALLALGSIAARRNLR